MIRRLRRGLGERRDAAAERLGRFLNEDRAFSYAHHRGVHVVGLGVGLDVAALKTVIDFVYHAVAIRVDIPAQTIRAALARSVVVVAPDAVELGGTAYRLLARRWPRAGVTVTRIQGGTGWVERFVDGLVGVIGTRLFPDSVSKVRQAIRTTDLAAARAGDSTQRPAEAARA